MDLKHLANMIITDIDCHVVKNADKKRRNHLGASEIGKECSRELWYKFRWVANKGFNGRMYRLFQRGHDEEPRFVKLLEQAGWVIEDIDPATGEQYNFSALSGHFGGSMDGKMVPPPGSQYECLGKVIAEFKTSADKYHKKLTGDNVAREHPQHAAQMHLYGTKHEVQYAVYLSVNKNNDDLACEILPIDPQKAAGLEEKARAIIFSQEPPPKINEDPAWWKCKFCDFHANCHHNKAPDKNCRSCKNCRPGVEASWFCDVYQRYIPKESLTVEQACWESII